MAKLARLMSPELPQFIEPARLADRGESLEGALGLDNMHRLLAVVENDDAGIRVHLSFDRNEVDDFVVITGGFSVDLVLRCQRCLEPLTIRLEKAIYIACSADPIGMEILPAAAEPLQMFEGRIDLFDLIEDEVLLGLPMSPSHDREECPATEVLERLQEKKESPFAILENLKSKKP